MYLDIPRADDSAICEYIREKGFHETYANEEWYPESEVVFPIEEAGRELVEGVKSRIAEGKPAAVYRPDGTYVEDLEAAHGMVKNSTHVWYAFYDHVDNHWLTRWNNGGLILFTEDAGQCKEYTRNDDGTLFDDDGRFPLHSPATMDPFPFDSVAGDYLYSKFHHLPYREVVDQSGELIGYELRPGEDGDGRVSDLHDDLTYGAVFHAGDAHYQIYRHSQGVASEPGDVVKPEEEIVEAA
ncbi:hypothetical protein DVR14_21020 (plasmid) [Natrinema thermotolerans]|nr:hypothetical protein DVR14_16900 [Natrinema thermotolerans]QCC61126.1 hypothetical protein DVR14_21020 [Natrinema thermotolerans]